LRVALAWASSNFKRQTHPLVTENIAKDYHRQGSAEKKNTGRESKGPYRQDELIGGKPPVVK
jgi:hypothetical protein